MRHFNKFFMSVKSSYLNNNKYNNTLFNNLRIYFERETKYVSNVSTFGNTFRNSKWSDLQKINIKESFLRTFVYASLTFIFLISVLMCFWGKSKSEHYLGFIPFFSVWDIALNQFLIFFNETQSQVFTIVFSLLVSLNAKLKNTVPSRILNLFHTTLAAGNTGQGLKLNREYETPNYVNKYALGSTSPTKTKHLVNILRSLSTLQNSLSQLKTPLSPNIPDMALSAALPNLQPPSGSALNPYAQPSITSLESNYGRVPTLNKMFHNPLNLKNIQNRNNLRKSLTYADFNLLTNINSGKEQRWLVKNSILTEFLTKNTNMFTQSKKLLGLANYDNNFSNKNIWLSSKLTNLNNTETLSYINNLNNSLYPTTANTAHHNSSTNSLPLKTSSLTNLNFFENSRLWTVKKFFFNNQMFNNLPSHSKLYTTLTRKEEVPAVVGTNKSILNNGVYKSLISNSTSDLSSLLWPILNKSKQLTLNSDMLGRHNNLTISTLNIDLLSNSDLNFIINLTSNIKSSNVNPNYCSPYPTNQRLRVVTNKYSI